MNKAKKCPKCGTPMIKVKTEDGTHYECGNHNCNYQGEGK